MRASDVQVRADAYLDYLFQEWRAVPNVARDWNCWDEADRLDFVIEWPIREDRLAQLQEWADQEILTSAQSARYDKLLALVNRHRHLLERLLRDEAA